MDQTPGVSYVDEVRARHAVLNARIDEQNAVVGSLSHSELEELAVLKRERLALKTAILALDPAP